MSERQKPANPHSEAYRGFREQTTDHQLVVLHDDGLYRHLRVQAPGTRMWSWDITTWPGHLATSGDIADGYMFTREEDMIEFFSFAGKVGDFYADGAPSIDVRYWAEKLCGRRSHEVKTYQPEAFLQHVSEGLQELEDFDVEAQSFHDKQQKLLRRIHQLRGLDDSTSKELLSAHWSAESNLARTTVSEYSALHAQYRDQAANAVRELWDIDDLSETQIDQLGSEFDLLELMDQKVKQASPAQRREEILSDARHYAGTEDEARSWLNDHEQRELFGGDTWEWDLRDYDLHFLFACYCIDLAVRLYREHRAEDQKTS